MSKMSKPLISLKNPLVLEKLSPYKSKPSKEFVQKEPEKLEKYIFPQKNIEITSNSDFEAEYQFKLDESSMEEIIKGPITLDDLEKNVKIFY